MASVDSFWKKVSSDVGVKVVAGTIAAVLLGGIAFLFGPVRALFAYCWDSLSEPVVIARWWWLVLWGVFLLSVGREVTRRIVRRKGPGWRELYFEDEVFGMDWRWRYTTTGRIEKLTPFCPRCRRVLRHHYEQRWEFDRDKRLVVDCQGCDFRHEASFDLDELMRQVEIEIAHRVDTGEWLPRSLARIENRPE